MRVNPRPATIATLALSFDGGAIGDNDRQRLQDSATLGTTYDDDEISEYDVDDDA